MGRQIEFGDFQRIPWSAGPQYAGRLAYRVNGENRVVLLKLTWRAAEILRAAPGTWTGRFTDDELVDKVLECWGREKVEEYTQSGMSVPDEGLTLKFRGNVEPQLLLRRYGLMQ